MGKLWANLQIHGPTTESFSFLLSIPLEFIVNNHILSSVLTWWSSKNQAVSPARASTSSLRIRNSLFLITSPSVTAYPSQTGMQVLHSTLSNREQPRAHQRNSAWRNQNFKHPLNLFLFVLFAQSYHKGKPWHAHINNSNISNRCVLSEPEWWFPLHDT